MKSSTGSRDIQTPLMELTVDNWGEIEDHAFVGEVGLGGRLNASSHTMHELQECKALGRVGDEDSQHHA